MAPPFPCFECCEAGLYNAARDACHALGVPWTDPRTGITHAPPPRRDLAELRAVVLARRVGQWAALDGMPLRIERRRGQRIDSWGYCEVGVPVDLGWAIGLLRSDQTFTRWCKGCGITVTTAVTPDGEVAEAQIVHADDCPILARLGNNPGLS